MSDYTLDYTAEEINEKLAQVGTNKESISQLSQEKVNNPTLGNGIAGQALLTNGDGTTYWGFVSSDGGSDGGGTVVDVLTSIKPDASMLSLGYIDKSSGNVLDNTNHYCTLDFIPFASIKKIMAYYSVNENKDNYPTVTFYDENKAFISGQSHSDVEQVEYDGKLCVFFNVPTNTKYIRLSYPKNTVERYYDYTYLYAVTQKVEQSGSGNTGSGNTGLNAEDIDKQIKTALLPQQKASFDDSFNYIAYSQVNGSGCSINTVEHFVWSAKQNFTALKGDVRPTSDGGLIMCHDAGFTLHTDGDIRGYNPSNETYTTVIIHDMTEEECLALKHVNTGNHVCNFETYIRICKKYGKIAFITIRDEYIDEIVPKMFEILDKYKMRMRSIVNSFTISSLEAVRNVDDGIMLSNVLTSKTLLTKTHIENAVTLGNCLINTFLFPFEYSNDNNGDGNIDGFDALEQSLEALVYAQEKDIRIYSAQNGNASDVDKLMEYGVTGAQMTVVPTSD